MDDLLSGRAMVSELERNISPRIRQLFTATVCRNRYINHLRDHLNSNPEFSSRGGKNCFLASGHKHEILTPGRRVVKVLRLHVAPNECRRE